MSRTYTIPWTTYIDDDLAQQAEIVRTRLGVNRSAAMRSALVMWVSVQRERLEAGESGTRSEDRFDEYLKSLPDDRREWLERAATRGG